MFENREQGAELRRMCGAEREEVTGDWRKLHSKELHLGNQIKEKEMGRACGMYGGEDKFLQDVKEREHLKDLDIRWVNNIKIDLKEIG